MVRTMSSMIKRHAKPSKSREPLWKGPEKEGVTFSLLNKFLACRERFRLLAIEGLAPTPRFDHKLEYGNMWHVCEDAYAAGQPFERPLTDYCRQLCLKYRTEQQQVNHWFNVCKVNFPIYVDHWRRHPEIIKKEPLLQEQTFSVEYVLPSRRLVKLLGKWDSVDLVKDSDGIDGIWLQENKAKGNPSEVKIVRQLSFDLQTGLYVVALCEKQDADYWNRCNKRWRSIPIRGVRYNVIRRPLSGGVKGNIVRHKATQGAKCPKCKGDGWLSMKHDERNRCPKCEGVGRIGAKTEETAETFYARLAEAINENQDEYFFRWNVDVLPGELATFKRECLNPLLEDICSWYDWVSKCCREGMSPFNTDHPDYHLHFRYPFGTYNVLAEGGSSEYDEFLFSGNDAGLTRIDNLFPELTT